MTVGVSEILLQGTLGPQFVGTPGLSVTVNGVQAQVSERDFESLVSNLSSGANRIVVVVTNANGAREETVRQVNFDPTFANNVTIARDFAYASTGGEGFAAVDLGTGEKFTVAPSGPAGSVDDIAVDGDLLFALDATGANFLTVYSIKDPASPELVSGPTRVEGGTFVGVSAGGGRVIVSGGTSNLSVLTYNSEGVLGRSVSLIDLGIGQPDVLIAADGSRAYVSTDFSVNQNGQRFGLTFLDVLDPPAAPNITGRIGLNGAGFSLGARTPSNFPIESALSGDLLFVGHGGGVAVIDTTVDRLSRTLSVGFPVINLDAFADRVFVVGGSRELAQIDISDTGNLQVVGKDRFPGLGAFSGVAVGESHVAIAANEGGLIIRRRSSL